MSMTCSNGTYDGGEDVVFKSVYRKFLQRTACSKGIFTLQLNPEMGELKNFEDVSASVLLNTFGCPTRVRQAMVSLSFSGADQDVPDFHSERQASALRSCTRNHFEDCGRACRLSDIQPVGGGNAAVPVA
jgi:hypothetical protein